MTEDEYRGRIAYWERSDEQRKALLAYVCQRSGKLSNRELGSGFTDAYIRGVIAECSDTKAKCGRSTRLCMDEECKCLLVK